MSTLLLAWCLAVLLAGPVVVLVHELGHAAAALVLTGGPVVVKTGRRALVTPRIGRLTLALGLALAAFAVLGTIDALANLWPALHPARRTVTGAPQESDGRIVARCLAQVPR